MGNERSGPAVKVTEWRERGGKAILAGCGDDWLGMVRQERRVPVSIGELWIGRKGH
jgi:hypothetical protein